ncbi:hypothetical protein U3516DRAFT_738286 [Neocallimastix sp. 'constans']
MRMVEEATYDDVRISIGSRGFVPKVINNILDPSYAVMGIIWRSTTASNVVATSSMFSGDKYQQCFKHPLDSDFSLIQVKTSLQKAATSAGTL